MAASTRTFIGRRNVDSWMTRSSRSKQVDEDKEEVEASKKVCVGHWACQPTMALYLGLLGCLPQSLQGTLPIPQDRINSDSSIVF